MKNKNVGIHENAFKIDFSSCKCISLMVYTSVSQSKGLLQEIVWYFHFFNFTIQLYLFVFYLDLKFRKRLWKGVKVHLTELINLINMVFLFLKENELGRWCRKPEGGKGNDSLEWKSDNNSPYDLYFLFLCVCVCACTQAYFHKSLCFTCPTGPLDLCCDKWRERRICWQSNFTQVWECRILEHCGSYDLKDPLSQIANE